MNDLRELMRENVASPPPDRLDLAAVVSGGRRRVRTRRATVGGAAVLVAGALVAATLVGSPRPDAARPADGVPHPDAPTLSLAEAERAVEGRDYDVVASITNKNDGLDTSRQQFDGVTEDGLVLFRGGLDARLALLDPATGAKDWLPDLDIGPTQTWPAQLGTDRLVLLSMSALSPADVTAHVFDRTSRQWTTMTWPGLPKVDFPVGVVGPDGRLYVSVLESRGGVPEGGWSTAPDGDAEDADAPGDTYHLWSVSLTDPGDVRDEGLDVGAVAFTDTAMVWTDRTNGDAGLVHVRDLASGAEHSFDPHAGDRCNLLTFGVGEDRVVMGQYCGTYDRGVRDDRVQVLDLDGNQVVTIQETGLEGAVSGPGATGDLVRLVVYDRGDRAGTYVYDLAGDRLLRVSDDYARWGSGGSAPGDLVLWNIPYQGHHGEIEVLARMVR